MFLSNERVSRLLLKIYLGGVYCEDAYYIKPLLTNEVHPLKLWDGSEKNGQNFLGS
jgi:hypothetical protein